MNNIFLTTGQYSGVINKFKHFNDLIASVTAYDKNNFNADYHYHENTVISFILQGGNIENRKQTGYERKTGDIAFFHSEEWHQTLPPKDASARNLNLEVKSSFFSKHGISETDLNLAIVQKHPDNRLLMLKMYKELLAGDELSCPSIEMSLLNIAGNPRHTETSKHPLWITKLREILHDEWQQNTTLSHISELLNVHPVTISKYFHRYFRCTLGEYLRKLKVERSIALIRENNHSLTEIAMICGFADQSHFTRNFKALTGLLPSKFKCL